MANEIKFISRVQPKITVCNDELGSNEKRVSYL